MGGIDISATYKFNIDGAAAMELARTKLGPKMKEKAYRVYDASQDSVPVLTGALKESGHVEEIDEITYQVIYDAPVESGEGSYARYVEEGTSKMDAQPYLRPAILAAKD